MSLTEQEILRYSRHIILPEVGGRGQKRIKAASVLVAGQGAAGSAAGMYLAAAGVGRITLWDPAELAAADLSGAIAHTLARIGQNRAESGRAKLEAINPDAEVKAVADPDALPALVAGHQVVVATTGDWDAVQAAAIASGAAVVFAGARGASGALFAYRPGEPCLGCIGADRAAEAGLVPEAGGTGGDGRVVAAAGGVIGTAAATEALKLILGIGTPLTGRLLRYDGWEARFRESGVARRAECPLCAGR
ncbi:adenylyltransferase/sulfurtransferase [Symbiobacterium terraclitae]|uniref:Adenylyltransferase/sulfurtransferase n=1 Tax=Symbiobacterium terraclitae TaxID=557451 RepID=A0ABS4JQQ4_9FIRM|nr:ThiF family adenylyltransferase [Symbiobacterium terraclitae]MBP2017221.1 adenylyltransferase/sulfurtransferase [Symbiobacterium terraclitae]